jgi:glucose-6-phosphate isomerase
MTQIHLEYDPGFPIALSTSALAFEYGPGVFGPEPEMRRLDAIRCSLLDPECKGPDPVYGIAMDIGLEQDRQVLSDRMLLFGAVVYAGGRLGDEPVRSQGHVHAIAAHSGWSPPEIFEIWCGTAVIYMQERAEDDPGRCFAITARAGDRVIAPPGWAHYVVNADPSCRMAFGACCDRQYGFEYAGVRAHKGLAWFPILTPSGIEWKPNPRYRTTAIEQRTPHVYTELGLRNGQSLYNQFRNHPDNLMFVADPSRAADLWPSFIP